MGQRRTLNERRLTKQQVSDLIASGAELRRDLTAALECTYANGYKNEPLVYELTGDRFLFVFDPKEPGLGGKGDIYSADQFRRLVRWTERVRDDYANGRGSSVAHWWYHSRSKHGLVGNIEPLMEELSSRMSLEREDLDRSYESLDGVSELVKTIGGEVAQQELYDHLVAYVGEVLRARTRGRWELEALENPPWPYVSADGHSRLMPINVVWSELSGLELVNLRRATANEVRRSRVTAI